MRPSGAWYLTSNPTEQLGSVFDRAVPGFSYSPQDAAVAGVAAHLQTAKTNPQGTYPTPRPGKTLPGFAPNDPLHRLYEGAGAEQQQRRAANESVRKAYCNSTEFQSMKPTYPAPGSRGTWDCDEYPFGSTFEGAGRPDATDLYSVQWVDSDQNQEAGARLQAWYRNDRILDGDAFFMSVPSAATAS